MNLGQFLLSPSGRVSRRGFWLFVIAVAAIHVIVEFVTLDAIRSTGMVTVANLIVTLIFLWPGLAIAVKRSHDRGRGWWFILLFLVPIVFFWPIVELYFLRGTRGDNDHGPDPAAETRPTWWIWIAGIVVFALQGYIGSHLDPTKITAVGQVTVEGDDSSSSSGSDSMDEAAGTAGEAASGAADAAADTAASAADAASDAASTAGEAASDAANTATDAAGDAMDSASDAASSAADTASDAMQDAQDKASDAASDAKSKMNDAMGAN